MVHHPVVLVREDDEAARDAQPTRTSATVAQPTRSNSDLLLQRVERSDALCLREPVVPATVHDEHRRRLVAQRGTNSAGP